MVFGIRSEKSWKVYLSSVFFLKHWASYFFFLSGQHGYKVALFTMINMERTLSFMTGLLWLYKVQNGIYGMALNIQSPSKVFIFLVTKLNLSSKLSSLYL
jgi:hypothetical protein